MNADEIVTKALREIRVIGAADAAQGEDMTLGLETLNQILDDWNSEQRAVYASTILTFTLTPDLQPHTIGPTGATWTADQRPEAIEAANLVADDIRYPIRIRDAAWWMSLSAPEASAEIPSDLYYEKAWPNGIIRFAGVPSVASEVELLTRQLLASLALSDEFTLPPGYRSALVYTLAEQLIGPFKAELTPDLVMKAKASRARVFSANTVIPRIATRDDGMPGGGESYDFRTRSM